MKIIRKKELEQATPFIAPLWEEIFEMFWKKEELGRATNHSLATVILYPWKCSPKHYHKISEEIYYVLSGKAIIVIDNEEYTLTKNDSCLIMPGDVHQIFNYSNNKVEFLVTSAPARNPTDTYEKII